MLGNDLKKCRTVSVRIFVKDFNLETLSWDYMRSERVAFPPKNTIGREAYQYRTGEKIDLRVFLMDWKEFTIHPLFTADKKDVSLCLDRLFIVCYEFEK